MGGGGGQEGKGEGMVKRERGRGGQEGKEGIDHIPLSSSAIWTLTRGTPLMTFRNTPSTAS